MTYILERPLPDFSCDVLFLFYTCRLPTQKAPVRVSTCKVSTSLVSPPFHAHNRLRRFRSVSGE
jgi:hypothetical protein